MVRTMTNVDWRQPGPTVLVVGDGKNRNKLTNKKSEKAKFFFDSFWIENEVYIQWTRKIHKTCFVFRIWKWRLELIDSEPMVDLIGNDNDNNNSNMAITTLLNLWQVSLKPGKLFISIITGPSCCDATRRYVVVGIIKRQQRHERRKKMFHLSRSFRCYYCKRGYDISFNNHKKT